MPPPSPKLKAITIINEGRKLKSRFPPFSPNRSVGGWGICATLQTGEAGARRGGVQRGVYRHSCRQRTYWRGQRGWGRGGGELVLLPLLVYKA